MLIPSMASAQASTGEQLCEDTGGTWVETSCGDYFCGQPPLCYALIPGCDCGEGMNFGEDGCFKDPEACEGISVCSSDAECEECETCLVGKCLPSSEPECLGLNDKKLCVDTGGQWDPFACGDAKCGIPNPCEAIIPGCNCGPTESFQSGVGCVEDPSCEGVSVDV